MMELPISSEAFCAAVLAAVKRIPSAQRTARFDALALDFHPWEDTLNLSLHAIDEHAPLVMEHGVALADWRFAHFALAQETDARAWPEGRVISAQLHQAFTLTEFDAEACVPVFEPPSPSVIPLRCTNRCVPNSRWRKAFAFSFRTRTPRVGTSRCDGRISLSRKTESSSTRVGYASVGRVRCGCRDRSIPPSRWYNLLNGRF